MSNQKIPTILVGVTGCIAAYKSCELVRIFQRAGFRVKVVMSEAATHFVGPTTFRALTGEPVAVSLWDEPEARVHHTSLAEEASVFVIAPATANVVAKIAQGRADDLLSTVALATEAPVILSPAMNVHMWRDEATCANIAAARARGIVVIEPESGELACGDVGEGRLADIEVIADTVLAEARRTQDLVGVRVLVTAGPTREPIDPVRFVSNASSGKTGFAIAEEAARRGANVTLVTGPTSLPNPFGVSTVRVLTALDMHAACGMVYPETDVVVATAAVADFRPAETSAEKVKKDAAPQSVQFVRNPDILAEFGENKGERMLIGFAAETSDVVAYARGKLLSKSLDLVVANDVSDPALGFGSDENQVWLVTPEHAEEVPVMPKRALARLLWDRIAQGAREAHERGYR